jgi:hypothetical protein
LDNDTPTKIPLQQKNELFTEGLELKNQIRVNKSSVIISFYIYALHNIRKWKWMKFDFFSRKKFKCDMCKEKFKTETELRQHSKLEHGGKR